MANSRIHHTHIKQAQEIGVRWNLSRDGAGATWA